MDVLEILRASVERGAPVTFHVHGNLEPFDPDWILGPDDTLDLIYQFLTSEQKKQIETRSGSPNTSCRRWSIRSRVFSWSPAPPDRLPGLHRGSARARP